MSLTLNSNDYFHISLDPSLPVPTHVPTPSSSNMLFTLTGYLVAYKLLLIGKVFGVHDHCVMHDGSPSRYSVLNEVNLSGILNSFGLVTVLAFVRFDHPIMKDFPSLFLYLKIYIKNIVSQKHHKNVLKTRKNSPDRTIRTWIVFLKV